MTTVGVRLYAVFSAYFMIIGGAFLIVILPMLAPTLQSASFVFGEFFSDQAADLGIPSTTCASSSRVDAILCFSCRPFVNPSSDVHGPHCH